MYTQCPNCDTLFRIGIPQLKAAQGKVRCGQCNSIFNALLYLSEQAPEIPTVDERVDFPAPTAPSIEPVTAGMPDETQLSLSPSSPQSSWNEPDLLDRVSASEEIPPEPVDSFLAEDVAATDVSAPELPADSTIAEIDALFDTLQEEVRVHQGLLVDEGAPPITSDEFTEAPLADPAIQADVAPAELIEPPQAADTTLAMTPDVANDVMATWHEEIAAPWQAQPAPTFGDIPLDIAEYEQTSYLDLGPAKKPYSWVGTSAWTLGILGLLSLLVTQYAYFMRNDLAQHPELRPSLEKLCSVVSRFAVCEIPLRQDLGRIALLNRDVRLHPTVEDALMANITLVNEAPFPQPYPGLQITLSDTNGTLIAKRRFQPSEYLDASTDHRRGMMTNGELPIVLQLATPSPDFQLTSWEITLF